MKKVRRQNRAFSLFELLAVIAIIVILFTITVPKMPFVNRFLVENEVDKMFTVFSFLQQRAIASNQEQEVVFDLAHNSYFYDLGGGSRRNPADCSSKPSHWPAVASAKASRLCRRLSYGAQVGWQAPRMGGYDLKIEPKLVTCKLPDAVKFGFLQGANGPPSSPNKPITNPITFKDIGSGRFKVTFYIDGKVQPGTVYFIDKNKNFMMALTCPISQVSFIRKYKYNQGKWVCLK